jgi:DNA-binding transcriptional MerR regulator
MSAKSTRTYLSIGEVLSLLRADFPDVTISKIRFLEGQGLVSPERTSSGYRKFHEPDVERLRFVLRHQREQFLPLKVIRERMEDAGLAPSVIATRTGTKRKSVSELVAALQETPPTSAPAPVPAPPATPAPATPRDRSADAPAVEDADPARTPPVQPSSREPSPVGADGKEEATVKPTTSVCTAEELATAAGLELSAIESLIDHGILTTTHAGKVEGFDEDAVAIAKAAGGFLAIGLEARHLKVLQHGVMREMGMIETLVLPLLQQRTPEGRVRAREDATHFARLSTSLRAALLRQELRRTVG